jgi:tRNA uracil 4-sulfurtransferase
MMWAMQDVLLVHYSEIGTKGKNRSFFEKRLRSDIARRLAACASRVRVVSSRLIADLRPDADRQAVKDAMEQVFGVAWFAFARSVPAEWPAIEEAVLACAREHPDVKSFKIYSNRADKTFPLSSQEICNRLGRKVAETFGWKVDLNNHDLGLWVEILPEAVCVFSEKHGGLRGMPGASSGQLLCLFSGGIDSPVAAWSLMRRGATVHLLHFHPFRNANEALDSKIAGLHDVLRRFNPGCRLYLAPHYPYQIRAGLEASAETDLVLFRRFMLRVAERLAEREGYKALVTGDCLGQVASQTLENMTAAQAGVGMPVFTPLISMDKEEIVRTAQKIGTYDLSILPYKDCCSLVSRHPKTRVALERIKRQEEKVDFPAMIEETMSLLETRSGKNLPEAAEVR